FGPWRRGWRLDAQRQSRKIACAPSTARPRPNFHDERLLPVLVPLLRQADRARRALGQGPPRGRRRGQERGEPGPAAVGAEEGGRAARRRVRQRPEGPEAAGQDARQAAREGEGRGEEAARREAAPAVRSGLNRVRRRRTRFRIVLSLLASAGGGLDS